MGTWIPCEQGADLCASPRLFVYVTRLFVYITRLFVYVTRFFVYILHAL